MPRTPLSRLIVPLALTLSATLPLAACADRSQPAGAAPQSQPDAHANAPHPDLYTGIRGQITELPVAGDPSRELKIHHEQIEEFKTKDGTVNVSAAGVRGMGSMTMPFPTAADLSLEGLSVGDKIEFDFAVNWGGTTGASWEVTRIEKLPADTEIDFTNTVETMPDDAVHQGMHPDDATGHDVETGTEGP